MLPGLAGRAGLTERQIGFNPRRVAAVDARHLGGLPFTLGVLGGHQMASARLGAHDFAARADLESFRNSFPRFAAGNGLRYKARKITRIVRMNNCHFSVG